MHTACVTQVASPPVCSQVVHIGQLCVKIDGKTVAKKVIMIQMILSMNVAIACKVRASLIIVILIITLKLCKVNLFNLIYNQFFNYAKN